MTIRVGGLRAIGTKERHHVTVPSCSLNNRNLIVIGISKHLESFDYGSRLSTCAFLRNSHGISEGSKAHEKNNVHLYVSQRTLFRVLILRLSCRLI